MKQSIRGVYRLEYLSAEGFPVYVAVTSDGRRVGERTCYPFEAAEEVAASLDALLDEQDPDPASWAA